MLGKFALRKPGIFYILLQDLACLSLIKGKRTQIFRQIDHPLFKDSAKLAGNPQSAEKKRETRQLQNGIFYDKNKPSNGPHKQITIRQGGALYAAQESPEEENPHSHP